jgi:hypothetical protein
MQKDRIDLWLTSDLHFNRRQFFAFSFHLKREQEHRRLRIATTIIRLSARKPDGKVEGLKALFLAILLGLTRDRKDATCPRVWIRQKRFTSYGLRASGSRRPGFWVVRSTELVGMGR